MAIGKRGIDDTSRDARAVMDELYAGMSGADKLRRMNDLTIAVNQISLAGLRMRHPDEPDSTLLLRLAELRLGADLVRKAYGKTADER